MIGKNKKTILLVEDEILIAMLEKKQLENNGYSIHHVTKGEEAVKTIRENSLPVDLILMDIDLGSGIDGTQAAEQILNQRDIPIVFLSSHIEPDVVGKTEKISSYGYVVKNSSITVLDASIKMAFKLFDAKMKEKAKEDALKESEQKYRLLHENAGIGIGYYTIDAIVISYNKIAAKHMNGVPEDFIGKSIYAIFPKHEAEFYHNRMKSAALSDIPVVYEDLVSLPTGNTYFVSTFTKIIDLSNNILGIQILSQDITERKKLEIELILAKEKAENNEIQLKAIFDNSKDAIGISHKGIAVLVNKAYANMFGYENENEIFGKSILEQISPKEHDRIKQYIIASNSGAGDAPSCYETIGIRKNGDEFPFEISINSLT